MQPETPQFLVIGEVLRPHGVRGEVRMRVLTENREQLLDLQYLYLAASPDDSRRIRADVNGIRFNKAYALLSLDGYRSRDDAERLRAMLVMIDREQATPLEGEQYYLFQLIGLRVFSDNKEIGQVKEVLETGANDVYIVDSPAHGELLLPAHKETIVSIDFDSRVITMSLPAGLLPAGASTRKT